jgi:hypothetical protein
MYVFFCVIFLYDELGHRDIFILGPPLNETQRTLARLLFSNSIVLQRLHVIFAGKCFAVPTLLKEEIESWAKDGAERIFM